MGIDGARPFGGGAGGFRRVRIMEYEMVPARGRSAAMEKPAVPRPI